MQALLEEFKKKAPADYQAEIPGLQVKSAIQLLDSGKFKEAEAKLLKVIELDPKYAQAYLVLGYTYGAMGDKYQAKENFQKAIALDSATATEAYNGLASVLLAEGLHQSAREHIDKALETDPKHVPTLMTAARLSLTLGDKPGTIDYLERAVAEKPETALPYTVLAEQLAEADQKERSVEMLKLGLKKEPYYGTALSSLVAILVDLGRYKEAEAPLQTIAEILQNPKLMQLQEQQQSGETQSKQVVSLQHRADGLHKYIFSKAKHLSLKQEDWYTANEVVGLALILKPSDLDTLRFSAMALWRQSKLDEAETVLRTILSLFPQDVKTNIMLGGILSARGSSSDAQKFVKRAYSENPDETTNIVSEGITHMREIEKNEGKNE
eukprot:TRINITY_DN5343_c0_g1_i1.p1 TRINITY_DN5343_c0_g1~~TRINITY_DN5343_c0_g1_i1.p1  ORF type:complete len:440 (+),score=134.60 TRINITY_DN5343_c0_g1_i1:179-1321(+)